MTNDRYVCAATDRLRKATEIAPAAANGRNRCTAFKIEQQMKRLSWMTGLE
jgi:hypothetical protein